MGRWLKRSSLLPVIIDLGGFHSEGVGGALAWCMVTNDIAWESSGKIRNYSSVVFDAPPVVIEVCIGYCSACALDETATWKRRWGLRLSDGSDFYILHQEAGCKADLLCHL